MSGFIIIGVDPGLSGAIAVLYPSGKAVIHDMPVHEIKGKNIRSEKTGKIRQQIKHVYDRPGIARILWSVKANARELEATPVYFVERVHAMPDQGVTSMFNMGVGYGTLLMAPAMAGIRYEEVAPQTWKKKILIDQGHDKDAAIYKAQQLFPSLKFVTDRGRKLDGRADAACIAEFGRRELNVNIPLFLKESLHA